MPRCENCGTEWTGGHLCPYPNRSGILSRWSRFTDAELAVVQTWNEEVADMVVIPDHLRSVDEYLAIELTREIASRQSGGTT